MSHPSAVATPREDRLHTLYFRGGILVVLTLGAVWGAHILIRMATHRSFTAVGLHEINAHGHAQIFGWVGLFIMGFGYQVLPRLLGARVPHPGLALAGFWMMLAGILLRSGLEAALPRHAALAWPALFGAGLEITAIAIFAVVSARLVLSLPRPLPASAYYILAALFWFVAQAVCDAVYFAATAFAPSRDALLALAANYQAPLRELQIHGLAMLMILGVSQIILPRHYAPRAPSRHFSLGCLAALQLGLLLGVAGYLLLRQAGHAWAGLWYLGILLLAGGALALTAALGVFSPARERDRSLKFFRAAYLWLALSMLMLALLPLHQFALLARWAPESEAVRIGFSHAYYGAIRHAVTVGFVSLMIVGVASRVVPTLRGVPLASLPALWTPFLLLNLGCAMRVLFQTLSDFSPAFFPPAGASGVLEVAGLAIWGVHLWRLTNAPVSAGLPAPMILKTQTAATR